MILAVKSLRVWSSWTPKCPCGTRNTDKIPLEIIFPQKKKHLEKNISMKNTHIAFFHRVSWETMKLKEKINSLDKIEIYF